MNQIYDKQVGDFTEKQRKAFRACMRAISDTPGYSATKAQLVAAIRISGAYNRRHDATKTLKMLLKNPNVPLEIDGSYVQRTDISE